jgi:pimeloyl-ACP methyl ester carboxylesterase
VLRYDLFGRGASARPRARYDLDLFVAQLQGLLDALGLGGPGAPVDLLGLSMGGAVAVGFAARFPARVRRLGLIAPAGLPRERIGGARVAKAVAAPVLGEALMAIIGRGFVRRGLRASFADPEREPVRGYVARAAAQADDPDFRRALLSTLRAMPLEAMTADFARAGAGREVLLLWGSADAIAPATGVAAARGAIPHVEAHVLDGAAHNLHYEEPDRANPLFMDFFGR